MKKSNALILLSVLAALFALISSSIGLFSTSEGSSFAFTTLRGQAVEIFGRGLYRLDTIFHAAGFRGADLITVFLVVPQLLVSTWLYARGSLRGLFMLIGSLVYILYNAVSLGIGAAYNPLFLLYIAIFSVSVFALGTAWAQVDFAALAARIQSKTPRRAAAIYLIFGGCATALLWLSDLLPPLIQSGSAPALLGPYTSPITYFIDIGIITPACVLAGSWLLRRDPARRSGRVHLAVFAFADWRDGDWADGFSIERRGGVFSGAADRHDRVVDCDGWYRPLAGGFNFTEYRVNQKNEYCIHFL